MSSDLSPRQKQVLALEEAHGKLHLLAVGINEYNSSSHFSGLRCCVNDAVSIKNTFNDVHELNAEKARLVALLSGASKAPSRGNIIAHLKDLAAGASEENRILFYFSGHGATLNVAGEEKFFLVPEDAYSDDDENAFVSFDAVKTILNSSAAKQKLIILDCCWSGPDVSRLKAAPPALSNRSLEEYMRHSKGVFILSASAFDEPAIEHSPDRKHSLFTYYLVRALSGQEPTIFDEQLLFLSGLYKYLSYEVQRNAKSQHRAQSPGLYVSESNDLILGNFRAPIVDVSSWDPTTAPIEGLSFFDSSEVPVTEILTRIRNFMAYTEERIEWMAKKNLADYLHDLFGEVSARLSSILQINPADITPDGCSLRFPGGVYSVSFESISKKKGRLLHRVQAGETFFQTPLRLPLVVEACGLVPSEMEIEFVETIEPMSAIPGLKARGWIIESQGQAKVVARHSSGILATFIPTAVRFRGFSPSELWGNSADKNKASLLAGVMKLVFKP